MTRWPSGRGAVAHGGDSLWGDWHGDRLLVDCEPDIYFDADGHEHIADG